MKRTIFLIVMIATTSFAMGQPQITFRKSKNYHIVPRERQDNSKVPVLYIHSNDINLDAYRHDSQNQYGDNAFAPFQNNMTNLSGHTDNNFNYINFSDKNIVQNSIGGEDGGGRPPVPAGDAVIPMLTLAATYFLFRRKR